MSDQSTRLSLPYLAEAQSQKHVTVNEGLRRLDALVHASVESASTGAEPSSPSDGEAYILPAGATGTAWAGQGLDTIAARQDGAWVFIAPIAGLVVYVSDENGLRVYSGSGWMKLSEPISLGVNASPDSTNKLTVKSDAVLISHDDVTPGSGDARLVINKSASAQTASLVFQTAFSGKAEFGLTGSDNVAIKVADDSGVFRDAIVIDRQTGAVS
ncbi:MAG: DUF2793 domain-containing protein, partial [Pseudomonadota bacterium]